ncbi:major facilitator superfamily domain-containing protein [Penicillium concentricum]|uniref:Major facilitator superfamily domain-containing protein n=1 Tax=Penicillium concentricum TaxID=293559 RepID=A0A9W9UT06_9EURO|nr:major facilitator superfamily domain-containing protein [Penicillium concentricum]KAJ5356262.1 major facilitator superfamily domain-containing protein [Penicillium concentricum]
MWEGDAESEMLMSRYGYILEVSLPYAEEAKASGLLIGTDHIQESISPECGPPEAFNQDEEEQNQENGDIVNWTGSNDPQHPRNFRPLLKWLITAMYGSIATIVTFASSVFSVGNGATAQEFGTSSHVMALGTALTVLGLALGPLVFGPLSELYGRRIPLLAGFLVFSLFNIPVAVAQNLQTIMVCRFIVGFGGSSGLAIVGGALNDIFPPLDRAVAVSVFAAATFIGSFLGPVIGGFVVQSIGWRWTQWITLIPSLLLWLIYLIFVPESYGPIILEQRAQQLRCQTGNWALHAKHEEISIDAKEILRTYLVRPVIMLFMEPILLLVSIYMSLIYGIIYLFLEAYPISFREERKWRLEIAGLPFIGLIIGVVIGTILTTVYTKTRIAKLFRGHGYAKPEEGLVPMMLGAILLPAGLFWFAWTSNPSVQWAPQVISGVPIGMGLFLVFLHGLDYIIGVYAKNANSAVAANVFLRSLVGAGFTMFSSGMYHNLGQSLQIHKSK